MSDKEFEREHGSFARNTAQAGDALTLLQSLPDGCSRLVFFDPQHRAVLDKLAFGNEGARQRSRAQLPAMTDDYIEAVCREIARVLRPRGYLMLWADTFNLCEAHHQRQADACKCVDLIAWDKSSNWHGQALAASWRLSVGPAKTANHCFELARSCDPKSLGREGRPQTPSALEASWIDRAVDRRRYRARRSHHRSCCRLFCSDVRGAANRPPIRRLRPCLWRRSTGCQRQPTKGYFRLASWHSCEHRSYWAGSSVVTRKATEISVQKERRDVYRLPTTHPNSNNRSVRWPVGRAWGARAYHPPRGDHGLEGGPETRPSLLYHRPRSESADRWPVSRVGLCQLARNRVEH